MALDPSLSVMVASTETQMAATTLAREWSGTTTTEEDARFELFMPAALAWVEAFLGYPIRLQQYAERVAGFGGERLTLNRTPVVYVSRLFEGTTTTDTATEWATSTFRVQHAEAGFLSRVDGGTWAPSPRYTGGVSGVGRDPLGGEEDRAFYVEYWAGYTLAGTVTTEKGSTSTGRTLPRDLELAVAAKAVEFWGTGRQSGGSGTGGGGVIEKRVGDLAIRYSDQAGTVAGGGGSGWGTAETLLAPYRRRR